MMNIKLTCIFFGILNLFLFLPANAFGQNYKVIKLTDLIESPGNFSEVLTVNEAEEIHTLVYDINPTIFINDSGIKTFGKEAPLKAEFNAGSYTPLRTSNPDYNTVKLLAIKIEEAADLNNSLDLSTIPAFQNLKYILVECTFDCSLTRIQRIFSNLENIVLLYNIATPE